MEFFTAILDGLIRHPTAAILVLVVIAFGWFVRDTRRREEETQAKIAGLYERHAEALRVEHAAHLQTALQVLPTSQKLVTCIEILERLTPRASA